MLRGQRLKVPRKVRAVAPSDIFGDMRVVKKTKTIRTIIREEEEALNRRHRVLSSYTTDTRAQISSIAEESGAAPDEIFSRDNEPPSPVDPWEDTDEEPDEIAHEGRQIDDVLWTAYERVLLRNAKSYGRAFRPFKTRQKRLIEMNARWASQIEDLATAFLCWKHEHPSMNEGAGIPTTAGIDHDPEARPHVFHVTAIHTYRRDVQFSVPQQHEELANVALIKLGLLGCSPVQPTVAIDLDTLELYHRLRRRHPRLGIQPMVQVLCDLHNVGSSDHISGLCYGSVMQCRTRFFAVLRLSGAYTGAYVKSEGIEVPGCRLLLPVASLVISTSFP